MNPKALKFALASFPKHIYWSSKKLKLPQSIYFSLFLGSPVVLVVQEKLKEV
jgi:hypothetical protein